MRQEERKKRYAAILFAHINGDSTKAIAERHGLSCCRINQILRSQGVRKKKDIEERHKCVVELHQEGKSRKEIVEETGLSNTGIYAILRGSGYRWIPKEMSCIICHTSFIQQWSNQKCCSDKCSEERNRRAVAYRSKMDIGIWKKCEFCGKQYKVYKGEKYTQKFCNNSCAAHYQYKKKRTRNEEILYLREQQELTFVRIGEIFGIHRVTARGIYRKQLGIRNLARAERLAELGR